MIDGIRLHAHIQDLYPHGIARLRLGTPNGPAVLRHGLDWLLASAAYHPWPLVRFEDAGVAGLGPHLQPSLPSSQAQTALTLLLRLRTAGLCQPLPLPPTAPGSTTPSATPRTCLADRPRPLAW